MKNRRAGWLLNPTRDKNWRQEPGGGERDDTCDHGLLSRSWKVDVCERTKKKKKDSLFLTRACRRGGKKMLNYFSRDKNEWCELIFFHCFSFVPPFFLSVWLVPLKAAFSCRYASFSLVGRHLVYLTSWIATAVWFTLFHFVSVAAECVRISLGWRIRTDN